MIELKNVSFAYSAKSKPILDSISYTLIDGATYIIHGDNGTGKTTLTKLVLGLLKPTTGSIVTPKNCVIGYLPDYNGIYPHLTVNENIRFRAAIGRVDYMKIQQMITDWIERYRLKQYINTQVKNLSLGTKKKVALICACLVNPDLLVLDEPMSGLDSDSRTEFIQMLHELSNDNLITLCISHDQELSSQTEYRHIHLKDGGLQDE